MKAHRTSRAAEQEATAYIRKIRNTTKSPDHVAVKMLAQVLARKRMADD